MIEVVNRLEVKGNTVGYYCYDGDNGLELEPSVLRQYILSGKVVNARLSGNEICLADDVKTERLYDCTGIVLDNLKGAVSRMEEIMTGRKKRSYPYKEFYREEDRIYNVVTEFCMQMDQFEDIDWYNPKLQPAVSIMHDLWKHEEWNYTQQLPYMNQLYNMVQTLSNQ